MEVKCHCQKNKQVEKNDRRTYLVEYVRLYVYSFLCDSFVCCVSLHQHSRRVTYHLRNAWLLFTDILPYFLFHVRRHKISKGGPKAFLGKSVVILLRNHVTRFLVPAQKLRLHARGHPSQRVILEDSVLVHVKW